jgi:hypothetical protein
MAWCLVKHRDNFTCTFYFILKGTSLGYYEMYMKIRWGSFGNAILVDCTLEIVSLKSTRRQAGEVVGKEKRLIECYLYDSGLLMADVEWLCVLMSAVTIGCQVFRDVSVERQCVL